ncbi:MAG: DUF11 domain-containing protein [Propionivibrio sp.]|nr:DUF11 domain-containing protein [Propionivibrio sp.]
MASVTVEAWGGGGAGGGATGNPAKGGGGAGGQYARKLVAVTPGNTYTIVVGAGASGTNGDGASGGDSTFSSTVVVAKGGSGGTGDVNGAAGTGSTAGGVGDVVYKGGDGTSGNTAGAGGAGGGGAGSTGAGGSASGLNGGSGTPVAGGTGGDGLTSRGTGINGSSTGGGGGGGYATNNTNRNGGDGGDGRVVLTYAVPPAVVSINRASADPTPANTAVSWSVTFSMSVTGVDISDFLLVQAGGASGASITSVSGSGANWTVMANSGSSSTGTLGLNLIDDDSIVSGSPSIPLGGAGPGNGNFAGQIYTLMPPVVTLTKTASTSSAVVGDVITFVINANNPYGVSISSVSISDILPAGMVYSTHVSSLGTVSVAGQNVIWAIPSLPANSSAQLTLAVSLSAQGSMTNTATSPGAVSASASVLVLANAITHFRMDEPAGSWTGAAGEVVDSGGTALHGRRRTTSTPTNTNAVTPVPTIQSQYSSVVGGFCNAGRFDGTAVVESADSPLFDYTTTLSASAWIYPTAYPTSDLYSILSNDVNYEFHLNPSGKLFWWWNAATLTSAATIPLNQWTHIAITFSSVAGAGRQRIYINGVADPHTNNWTGSLAANACPFYIGGDIGTGSGCSLIPARNFRGMIDEVKLYNFELGAAEVQADMNLGRSCLGAFDHIQIEHDGVASICAPETVILKACLDSSCSTLYTGTVNIRLSPTGWIGGDTFSFSGGITSKQLSYGTAGNVTLGTVSVSPTPTNLARCFKGSTETCTMNFAAASCSFDAVEVAAAPQSRLFTKLAGVPFNVDVLALSNPTTVNTTYTGTVAVDLVDASISACPTGTGLNAATNITYVSGNNGRKAVAFTYPNAARNVRVRAKAGTSAPACSTDSFTVRPQGFSSIFSSANADNTGVGPNLSPAVKAGAVFTLSANTGVVGYDGNPKANPVLIEWLSAPSGGRPAPGTGALDGSTPGNLSFTTAAAVATGNGASGSFTYDETGYFRFKAQGVFDDSFAIDSSDKANGDCIVGSFSNVASAGKYGCNFGNLSVSNHFGRFVPEHFDTALKQACVAGNFTYSGQPFPLRITARNLLGGTTQNYSGGFAKAVSLLPRNTVDTVSNPGPGAVSPATLLATEFTAGIANPAPMYTFTAPQTAPTSVRIRASESEVTSLRMPTALTVEGVAAIVSGRARLSNAYGSEFLDLPIAFRTESWNGSGWVLNTLDSCTGDSSLGAANSVSVSLASAPIGLPVCIWDNGSPGLSGAGACATVAPPARRYREGATPTIGFAGDFNLWLKAPGANNFGTTTIAATVPAWLGVVPPAIATFGRYKTPLIYRRENY